MTKIITTVGTSIFTNQTKDGKNPDIKSKYDDLDKPNYSFEKWNDTQVKEIIEGKQGLSQTKGLKELVSNQIKSNSNASAEIKSILKIVEETQEDAKVYLLATDTVLSVLACKLVRDWFNSYKSENYNITVHFDQTDKFICKGLQINNSFKFRNEGLKSLLANFNSITNQDYFPNITLNITGGYKALIPYLTILGQIQQIRICYIFENTDSLIWFPQIPINVDYTIFQSYNNTFKEIIKEDIIEGNWEVYKSEKGLPDFFDNFIDTEKIDGEPVYSLNFVGKYYFDLFEKYIPVDILKGNDIFSENAGNRAEVINALKELHRRITNEINNNQINSQENLIKHIIDLGDKHDLRHGNNPKKDIFIFKSTNTVQIRLVYTPVLTSKYLSIKIYDYKRGQFKHGAYISEFNNKYKFKNEFEFIKISIQKES